MENTEPKSEDQLWKELLESIDKQLEVNMRLKKIIEPIVTASAKSEGPSLTEETVSEIKDLVIEAESLQAEGKAIFHLLFGVEDE